MADLERESGEETVSVIDIVDFSNETLEIREENMAMYLLNLKILAL